MTPEQIEATSKIVADATGLSKDEAIEMVQRRLLYGSPKMDLPFVQSYLRNPEIAYNERLRITHARTWAQLEKQEQLAELLATGIVYASLKFLVGS